MQPSHFHRTTCLTNKIDHKQSDKITQNAIRNCNLPIFTFTFNVVPISDRSSGTAIVIVVDDSNMQLLWQSTTLG